MANICTRRVWCMRVYWIIICLFTVTSIIIYLHFDKSHQKYYASNATLSDNRNILGGYPDDVGIRIIVMTYNRAESLRKLLSSLDHLELDGDKGLLEIYVDRKATGNVTVDHKTLHVAESFKWKRGETHVIVHDEHVGLYGQWIDTWRPRVGSRELALLLEDDLSISPFAYRWLRAAHNKYGSRKDIAGYTLQSGGIIKASGGGVIKRPTKHVAFLYKLLGSWGYAPHPQSWREFRMWYHKKSNIAGFHPYVAEASRITGWYKKFEKRRTQQNMWTMWHVCYSDTYHMYTLYNNIIPQKKNLNVYLSVNREEPGLHFGGKGKINNNLLLNQWSDKYVAFDENPPCFNWNGLLVN